MLLFRSSSGWFPWVRTKKNQSVLAKLLVRKRTAKLKVKLTHEVHKADTYLHRPCSLTRTFCILTMAALNSPSDLSGLTSQFLTRT